jgi:hypothetical protein
LSGTGLLLLGLGVSVLVIRRGAKWAAQVVFVLGLVVAAVALTPIGSIIAPRLSETTSTNTSGNARFIAPYTLVADGLSRDIPALLVGRGPGAVARTGGNALFNPDAVEINYPAVPKLAAEYGLITAIAFTWFIAVGIAGRARAPTIAAGLLLLYFVLSGSLLQPATLYTSLVFGAFFRLPAKRRAGPLLPTNLAWAPHAVRSSGATPQGGGAAAPGSGGRRRPSGDPPDRSGPGRSGSGPSAPVPPDAQQGSP